MDWVWLVPSNRKIIESNPVASIMFFPVKAGRTIVKERRPAAVELAEDRFLYEPVSRTPWRNWPRSTTPELHAERMRPLQESNSLWAAKNEGRVRGSGKLDSPRLRIPKKNMVLFGCRQLDIVREAAPVLELPRLETHEGRPDKSAPPTADIRRAAM
jgi:hypothetical protein